MTMTKRDYQVIAQGLREMLLVTESPEAREALVELAKVYAMHFKLENPRFDYSKFMRECSLQVEIEKGE